MKERIITIVAGVLLIAAVSNAQSDTPFQVRYLANLNIGDAVINISNTGASSTVAFPKQNGNLCANVYAYDAQEELIACCSCLVTPNGLASLSAKNDLISNTLTPQVPNSIVVKLLASRTTEGTAASCNPSTVGTAGNGLAPGLVAWATTIHTVLPAAPADKKNSGSPAVYGVTETAFTPATLSAAELARATTLCGFIQTNGSGFGICKSCRVGGLAPIREP